MEGYNFVFLAVSQDCMLSLFVMLTSLWMEFWEYKTESFLFLSVTERIDVVVNSIADNFGVSEDVLTGALSEKVESWD